MTFPMEPKVVEVDDTDFHHKRPVAIERGPLLFALPVAEQWTAIEGVPLTPLPEGWAWYEARPATERATAAASHPWSYAVDRAALRSTTPMRVVYEEPRGTHLWQQSPVKIMVPARKIADAYPAYLRNAAEVYTNPVATTEPLEMIELVPYGCTTLRITYFPVCRA